MNSNELREDLPDSKRTPNERPKNQEEDDICVVCRDSWRNLSASKVKRMRLTCNHDLCSKCLNRLKTNPRPGSVPRFLNAINLEPVHSLGYIPAEAYEALNRPELQFQFGDDEELERYDREEAERDRVLAEFGLVPNTGRPTPIIKCPLCRATTNCDQVQPSPASV